MDAMGKPRSPQKKERWLLTRKTWRYMADAGRRLIPGGGGSGGSGGATSSAAAASAIIVTEDDLPKIEAYFQEVCAREPRFLPWRKQSYPGALGFRRSRGRRRGKGGSCRDRPSRPSSADEAETGHKSGGDLSSATSRADLSRLRHEFLFGSTLGVRGGSGNDDGSEELLGTLQHYLYGSVGASSGSSISGPSTTTAGNASTLDTDALLERLKAVLAEVTAKRDHDTGATTSVQLPAETTLYEVLRRYFRKSTNRDHVISDLLTDRKRLEGLYFELRKAREFRGRGGGRGLTFSPPPRHHLLSVGKASGGNSEDDLSSHSGSSTTLPSSPVGIEEEPSEISAGTQTRPISQQTLNAINEEVKKIKAREELAEKEAAKAAGPSAGRRSSVDNDDVSRSVSDTIKRYLRMARKKSVDSDKADRFKRVNYDRNLRNIKGKGEPSISEDDGLDKSAQTDESWVEAIKELKRSDVGFEDVGGGESSSTTSPPTSPPSHTTSFPHFLSSLLHPHAHHQKESAPPSPTTITSPSIVQPGGMHKSKSSTSVVSSGSRLVAKKIWKSRSKSQSRATPSTTSTWVPKGKCTWTNVSGRAVQLSDTSLQNLTEIERRILQKVALAKLQALNLGVTVKVPSEITTDSSVTAPKPKRKAYLLKRKAITTGIFDSTRNKDDKAFFNMNLSNMTTPRGSGRSESSSGTTTGLVFGIPLGVCVENERKARNELLSLSSSTASTPTAPGLPDEPPSLLMRRKSNYATGSRGSFSSLIETPINPDEKGSLENLITPTLSMPGLDNISLHGEGGGSTNSLVAPVSDPTRSGVPNLVQTCLRHLEGHGLNTLGIFRVSSSKKRVRQLREDFDCGKELNLEDELCPHDVATLLKEYFRDLPDPLLCKDLYAAFIQTQRIRNRRLQHEAMQHLLQLLPSANRDTLFSLLSFLALVASRSDDYKDPETGEWISGNKMDSSNLATLFAPNILHNNSVNKTKDEMSQERIEERSDAINVIRSLIDNFELLFKVPAELLDEVYIHMMDTHPESLDELLRRKETADDPDDITVSGDDDRKYWSREAFTHESAATGGPDLAMRPRRMERSKERQSKKRRDESARRDEDSPRRASLDDKTVSSSGGDSGRLSPQACQNEGVITASLKIPVTNVTSLLLNLDDIPYIEDAERHHIALALAKPLCGQGVGIVAGGGGGSSESGVGSFSPPSRPPSVASSWDSGSEMPPVVSSISINPSQQSTVPYVRSELSTGRHATKTLTSHTERLTKSASSTAVISRTPAAVAASISSIGGEVLRSKTADIERMIRRHSHTSSPTSSSGDSKRRYADSRQATRGLPELSQSSALSSSSGSMGSGVVDTSSAAASRSVWKRRELISSSERRRMI